ncbi:MAG: 50S ribosomal protein L24 [Candidatus Aureabacteria bacterium]|nr:50S ribosomal protein L24 [Candidatus Auribacterota bacterium]
MSKMRVKKDDTVQVVAGAEKGKTGRILSVIPGKGRLIIESINFRKKHTKPSRENQQGGIIQKESSISVSNVLLYCPSCKKGVKIRKEIRKDGSRTRICKKCGEVFDKS